MNGSHIDSRSVVFVANHGVHHFVSSMLSFVRACRWRAVRPNQIISASDYRVAISPPRLCLEFIPQGYHDRPRDMPEPFLLTRSGPVSRLASEMVVQHAGASQRDGHLPSATHRRPTTMTVWVNDFRELMILQQAAVRGSTPIRLDLKAASSCHQSLRPWGLKSSEAARSRAPSRRLGEMSTGTNVARPPDWAASG